MTKDEARERIKQEIVSAGVAAADAGEDQSMVICRLIDVLVEHICKLEADADEAYRRAVNP